MILQEDLDYNMTRKLLIGLGCSWTQGEGGYTKEIWDQYNGRVNLPMHESIHLIPMENEHSWVNVLTKKYLTSYEPINLGQRGIGNRGAAKSLYLTNINWNEVSEGIVVFLLSGFERFDFFRQNPNDFAPNEKEHSLKHSFKDLPHYNFNTMWPHMGYNDLWTAYGKMVYSEEQTVMETLTNILEVQTFCKANNLTFILASAFDGRCNKDHMMSICPELAKQVNWDNYLHGSTKFSSFAELLVEKDNITPYPGYSEFYQKLKSPAKYLANCIHPTIEGYKVIAEEMSKFIDTKLNKKTKRLFDI